MLDNKKNMKKIIVIVTYSAYVPDDMTADQLRESIESEIRDNFDDFRATAKDYHTEEEAEPLFDISDVMVGTESMISIGGN